MLDPAQILIVDDIEENRQLLNDFVVAIGHTAVLAENGLSALAQMRKASPDLVLLDILMPEMDGFEVLEQMKNDTTLCHLPVIMISALDDMDIVARCVEKGADDYLIKPFNHTFLRARIGASLERKRLREQEETYRRKIEEFNLRLEDRVRERTKELSEAHERLSILDKAKSDFLVLIAHELRTPLNVMLQAADISFDDNLDDATRKKWQETFREYYNKLLTITKQAHLLTKIEVSSEKFSLEPNSLRPALVSAVESAAGFAESRGVRIGEVPDCDWLVLGDKDLLVDAFAALLESAVKFSGKGEVVNISCQDTEGDVCVGIRASGRTIPEDVIPDFFDVLSIVDPITPGGDLGLGPPVAESIMKLFGGSVTVKNEDPPGISLAVKLKLADKKSST